MTVFVVSLFLPKTVHFNLPGASQSRPRIDRLKTKPPALKAIANELGAPSLFTPLPTAATFTPPQTPRHEQNHPFLNEDGSHIRYLNSDGEQAATPIDQHSEWTDWGTKFTQPRPRTVSPPQQELTDHARVQQKARELGRRGITQPRPGRSESFDKVFANADWKIVNSEQGNGRLQHATKAATRDGLLDECTWIGTLGMPTDALSTEKKQEIGDALATEHDMLSVFCSDKDFDGHYTHFCKQMLWPVFHYQIPDNPKSKAYEDHSWKYYVAVNQAFADKIIKNWKRGDVIWVHDYHLLLVPGMVRAKLPDAKIGLFLHLAFPSSEVFRCLGVRKQLLEGMLGANLVGFQIQEYSRHFLQTCSRLLSVEATTNGLQLEDRFVNVVNMPVGIDPANLNKHRGDKEVLKWIEQLKEKYGDMKIIVARDKLDHVRGVRQKLLSYELFLNKNPEWRGKIVLIQVALSTKEKTDLDATVSDIVTRVNSSWANLTYQPVVYLRQDIDYAQYLALLAVADALMITSQREGMNLTCHEYIYCQDGQIYPEKKHGSLILSEFTGSSSIFQGQELAINPWDSHQCADAIKQALEMSSDEKDRRWNALQKVVCSNTAGNWFSQFLSRLDTVHDEQHRKGQTSVPRLNFNQVAQQYERTQRRLFVLDFEGTLVNWGPMDQIIGVSLQRSLDVLNDLLLDERNTVYVTSGRSSKELDRLFRRVPNLGLIAENGCYVRNADNDNWVDMADEKQIQAWKQSVKPTMDYYVERAVGSTLEERRCGLIFNYKNAEDYEAATRLASDCASHVNDASEGQRVHAFTTDSAVVVELLDWTTSSAVEKILDGFKSEGSAEGAAGLPDFLMVIGDSREDEKVFKWANELGRDGAVKEVVTVSLGSRNTEAASTLTQGVSGVLNTLQKLSML